MEKTDIVVERRPVSSLALFGAKAVMVGIVAVVSAWIISDMFIQKIDERMAMIEQKIASKLPSNTTRRGVIAILAGELSRTASSDFELTPEEQKAIIADLKTLADRWRPFLLEASAATIGPSSPPAAK